MQRSPDIQSFLTQLITEDLGRGDITSAAIIPETAQAHYAMNTRESLVVSGMNMAMMLFTMMDERIEIKPMAMDGQVVEAGAPLLEVRGPVQPILATERVALNLLQHMCGIATHTARFVQAVDGTNVRIADTRKTAPGLREMQKYAVRCGGGFNHRMGLDDGVLIKDNHIAIAGGITQAVQMAKAATPLLTKIEVECDTLDQVKEAAGAQADQILLDNMSPDQLEEAVSFCKQAGITTEASGNVRLENVKQVAESGVDVISIGALTHSAPAVDIGLDLVSLMQDEAPTGEAVN